MFEKSQRTKMDKVNNHLANERTFLAWIRTSISIIVFGFVVAKFGITIREFLLLQNHTVHANDVSLSIGVGFMVMGITLSLFSLIRYQITRQNIDSEQFKPGSYIIVFLGVITALFGAVLTVYLIMTSNSLV